MKTNITKQIILGTIITLGLFSAAKAQTAYDDQTYSDQDTYNQPQQSQPQQYQEPQYQTQQYQPQQYQPTVQAPVNNEQSFYYYPDANVYYDNSCGRYIYNNGGAWLSVNVLPRGIFFGGPRYMVYHRGPQVWLDNSIHARNYRVGYRQPIVAYNNYRNGGGFNRGGFAPRNDFRTAAFRGNGGFNRGHGGRRF